MAGDTAPKAAANAAGRATLKTNGRATSHGFLLANDFARARLPVALALTRSPARLHWLV